MSNAIKHIKDAAAFSPEIKALNGKYSMQNLLGCFAKKLNIPNSEAPTEFAEWLNNNVSCDLDLLYACRVWFCCCFPGILNDNEADELIEDLYKRRKPQD